MLDFFLSAEGDETDLYVARDRERKATNSQRARLHAPGPDRRSRQGIRPGRGAAGQGAVRRELRAVPFEPSGHAGRLVQDSRFLRRRGRPSAQGAQGLPRQRRIHTGDRSGHLPLPRAALQPRGGPSLLRIRLGNPAQPAGGRRHSRARRAEGQRPRLLPQYLAAQRVGDGALHAQQRDRSRGVRQAEERGERLLPQPLRGRLRQAARSATAVRGLRPERRRAASTSTSGRCTTCCIRRSAASSRR